MHEIRALGPLLGWCGHLARERMDARLAQSGVTPAQARVLHYLYHHSNQAPQCEVTEHLRVKPSTANGILDRMEEKGLVERTALAGDARKKLIVLTEKGSALQETCRQVFLETETLLMCGLSTQEQEKLFAMLRRVMNNLEEDRTT